MGLTKKDEKKEQVFSVQLAGDKAGLDLDEAVDLEDALDQTGMGRYNYLMFLAASAALMGMALETFGTSYVVTSAVCDLQLSTSTKGLVSSMPMLGVVLSSHMWGYVADTSGRRLTLLISLTGAWLCAWIGSFSPHWLMLAICKFLSAFFASASNSVVFALFGESTPRAQRNKFVMLMSSVLMFAQGLMSLIAFPTLRLDFSVEISLLGISYRPWRLLAQVYGGSCGVAALLLARVAKESPKFYMSRGMEEESLRVLAHIFTTNTGKPMEEYPVKKLRLMEAVQDTSVARGGILDSIWRQTIPLLRPPLLKDTLIILYMVAIVYSVAPSFMMWMPSIANAYARALAGETGHANHKFCDVLNAAQRNITHDLHDLHTTPKCVDRVEDLTFLVILVFSAILTALNTLNSFLIRYTGKRLVVMGYHALGGVCGLLLGFVTSAELSVFVFFAFQLNLVCMGLMTAFTVERYPTYLRAMAVCLTMMAGRGMSILTINFVGSLLEKHCEATFFGFGTLVLSGALVSLLLPQEQLKTDKQNSTEP